MNTDIFKGKWHQTKGEAKRRWSKLTDDDIGLIEGDVEILSGKLQEYYGWSREKAYEEIDKAYQH